MKPLFKSTVGVLSLAALSAAPLLAQDKAAPTNYIVETAVAAGTFKTLAAALTAAGLVDTLKEQGRFIVDGPFNQRFRGASRSVGMDRGRFAAGLPGGRR